MEENIKNITVNGHKISWEPNMTIDRILKIKNYTFKMLVVKVNGELTKKHDYSTKIIPIDADVRIIHLISGG